MSSVSGQGISYQEFINRLNEAGIKTTSIREGKEANFADYGNALSDSLKQEIIDSFDCEQDYILQGMIADLYNDGRNELKAREFKSACEAMGLKVSVSYQKTSYIADYKGGNFDNSVSTGSIAVYTISDGMGGEIKIADANGNGALESEEIFMNQILGDINYEISVQQGVSVGNLGVQQGKSINEKEDEKVSQSEFNTEVENKIRQGYDKKSAIEYANLALNTYDMDYSGQFADILEDIFVEKEEDDDYSYDYNEFLNSIIEEEEQEDDEKEALKK